MPITTATVKQRVTRVREAMAERDLDALVVYSAPAALQQVTSTSGNVRYLTNWSPSHTLRHSMLLLPQAGDAVLFVHYPIFPECEQDLWVTDVREEKSSAVSFGVAGDLISSSGYQRIGLIGRSEMPVGSYEVLQRKLAHHDVTDADDILARLRLVKDPEELDTMRRAARIADAMLYAGMHSARAPEAWAHTVMLDMQAAGRRLGASFAHCWLDTGPAPAYTYHETEHLRRRIVDGHQLHTGTYVVLDGYWAHQLRMGVRGRVTDELRRHFELSRDVQDAGLGALKPGRPLREVAEAMEELIRGYSPYTKATDPLRFRQAHGLGLEYSEPLLTEGLQGTTPGNGEEVLAEPGMVMELHPNFNAGALGMTVIGDMVHVTETGTEFLTSFPRELYEI